MPRATTRGEALPTAVAATHDTNTDTDHPIAGDHPAATGHPTDTAHPIATTGPARRAGAHTEPETTMTSRTARRSRRLAAALTTVGIGALALAPLASAEDAPTTRELLEKCNNGTDSCVFHPDGAPSNFPGERKQVGRTDYNCSPTEQRYSVAWSDTTQESNSVGVAFKIEAGFGEVFKATMETNYSHTWTSGQTKTETSWINVPPGHVGQIFHAPEMQRGSGQYELHFGDRFHDHYIWYVPFESTSAVDNDGTVTQSTREMTPEERAQCPAV